ncbi:MAG: hypothetical protein IQL11_08200 [Bacteroidales bacterium]|nr:hypothetical protein [Bacteroidales bacterium]
MSFNLIRHMLLLLLAAAINSGFVLSQDINRLKRIAAEKLGKWENPISQWRHIARPKLDSLMINMQPETITLFFAPPLSYYPFREESCQLFTRSLKEALGRKFRKYNVDVITNNYLLNQLVPNYFRKVTAIDSSRIPSKRPEKKILVQRLNDTYPQKGLAGNSIALWHSHGYYFEMNLDRWEWQRARLFGTVEDISVMGFVVPYLTRMLENAGANVFLPRERDVQINEVIVDNDRSTGSSEVVLHLNGDSIVRDKGFLLTDTIFAWYNPFRHGTSLIITGDSAVYIPEIPETGSYAVSVSYPASSDNSESVRYTVKHTGGNTGFIVNQSMGAGTWIYLGTFHFRKGKNAGTGSVTVRNNETGRTLIALDAVRFGGGMGNVARRPSPEIIKNQQSAIEKASGALLQDSSLKPDFGWKLSGKPRFLEAARYYLQYSGMPDTLVYSPNTYRNDYNDDYQSRSLWVNYLLGDQDIKGNIMQGRGLGIPLDLSFAFHTDAGVTPGDSVIGTLAIYSTGSDNGKFPDGKSRMASRDLSDIIQTEVVEDIRKLFDPHWTRRGLWDRPYYEARRPNVPGTLLELLSHQNLADQRYGLDPRFRFHVSRAVYKGILKYLAYIENREYVVQPLPVKNFAITPLAGKTIRLSWAPVTDPEEPSSIPDKYLIYKRSGDNGFDNGIVVEDTRYDTELESYDSIYSFKVTGVNAGGESFDSEILSAGIKAGNADNVLVVNGFDRISGPKWIDRDAMAGTAWWDDRGVADRQDIITIGDQYDFNRSNPWLDDDSPGWGATYSDMAGKVIHGNTFDYPFIHGKAIMAAGYSFYSVSDEYFCSDEINPSSWKNIDLIFGEEKSTPFFNDTSRIDFKIYTPEFMDKIADFTRSGSNIFMSGAYLGSDMIVPGDSAAIRFGRSYLHFLPRTGHAVRIGEAYATDYSKPAFEGIFKFNTGLSESIYQVEAPDAIEPSGRGAICSFRYSENNSSAGIAFRGDYKIVILGFPFETITGEEQRNRLMKQVLNYFKNK